MWSDFCATLYINMHIFPRKRSKFTEFFLLTTLGFLTISRLNGSQLSLQWKPIESPIPYHTSVMYERFQGALIVHYEAVILRGVPKGAGRGSHAEWCKFAIKIPTVKESVQVFVVRGKKSFCSEGKEKFLREKQSFCCERKEKFLWWEKSKVFVVREKKKF